MNKNLILAAIMSLSAGYANAQISAIDADLDTELDQVSVANPNNGPQVGAGTPSEAVIAPNGSVSGQPIYILNQATPTSNAQVQTSQVQKQPQVDITASPLQKSRAEQIREARQQVEVDTENRIVEKLEVSRIEDEKRRANVLFGQQFDQLSQQNNNINAQNVNLNQQTNQGIQQVPVQMVPVQLAPVAPVAPAKEDDFVDGVENREWIREEIRAALKTEEELPVEPLESRYFGAIIGIGDYPDVRNVRGNYLLGATFGTKFDNAYAIEGSFTYGDYSVEQYGGGFYDPAYGSWVPRMVDVQQYSGSLAAKYMLFDGMVKPVFGGLVQYSYRNFRWSQDQYNYAIPASRSENATSHAIDVGVIAGADIDFSKKFSLGLDFRYMYNLSSRVDTGGSGTFLTSPQFGTPIEKLQYYTMSLIGKVNF